MNWLTKLLTAHSCKSHLRSMSRIVGIVAFSFSGLVIADPLHQVAEQDGMTWDLAEINEQIEALADSDLSFVNGKGAEELVLDGNGRLAIILWDERGNDSRRGTHHDVNGRSAIQLTVVHK